MILLWKKQVGCGQGKVKSKRRSAWLGCLDSFLSIISLHWCWVHPFPSQGTLSGNITTFSHIFWKSCGSHLGASNKDAGGGSQGQRLLRVSWFPPPFCSENDASGGGILTLLGSGFPTNKRQIGTAAALTSPLGALQRVGP